MKLIIKHCQGGFWTGTSFSEEYPDAMVFDKLRDAKEELKAISIVFPVQIINNYGLVDERIVVER